MQYQEIIKKVQDYSDCTEGGAKEVTRAVIENIASKLDEGERKDFASQLPKELKAPALSVARENEVALPEDIYEAYSLDQGIDKATAKRQIMAVWNVLEELMGEGQIAHLRGDLPRDLTEEVN